MPFRPTPSESMDGSRASYDFPAVPKTSWNEVFLPGSDGNTVFADDQSVAIHGKAMSRPLGGKPVLFATNANVRRLSGGHPALIRSRASSAILVHWTLT